MSDWLLILLAFTVGFTAMIVFSLLIGRRLRTVANRDYPIAKRRSDFFDIMDETGDEVRREVFPHPQRRRTDRTP